ncbi:hypothetical protein RHSIM_Rhsim06G0116200 [Rhododendron simsii]|uniref:Protein kinase domain-containing protein n=1 Tax=Rhododendron simsii TaxID=118357 RepID=A0A834GVI4_RHOSS|nr:hypothetical protein RHSIM_Rhsim06G0116200 [Rhododendron simsii]
MIAGGGGGCCGVVSEGGEECMKVDCVGFLLVFENSKRRNSSEMDFFSEYGDANRYQIQEVIGKGSYGVVCSAIDTHTGEKVAIKKIRDIFEHISDAARILREIKLLRLLRHPDIVEIKHIMLPPSRRDFKDIYVVFELMESDLHQVIKANDDLTREHYQFFLYQLLRALKYIHTANVYHRDLKPKNILANANCKLKICDFGLARVAFSDTPTTILWTDYVATRWYRAPELCGSFFSKVYSYMLSDPSYSGKWKYKWDMVYISCIGSLPACIDCCAYTLTSYTPAIDIWSIGCIFAEVLTGKPLFPGKNVVHQLDLMTDLLGTPSMDTISRVRNEKARRYLTSMRKKQPVPFAQKFPNVDPLALRLLERLLAFDPKDRPNAEEALSDPYFKGLAKVEREPSCQPITKMEFEFERRKVTKEDLRELIFREILEYHPQLLKDYMNGIERTNFLYPSALDQFRKQFAHLEENGGKNGPMIPPDRKHASLPRIVGNLVKILYTSGTAMIGVAKPGRVVGPVVSYENGSVTRNAGVLLPPQANPPAYCYRRSVSGKLERSSTETERERDFSSSSSQAKQVPQFGMAAAKLAPDIAINIDNNPFYMTRAMVDYGVDDRVAIDANLLQAKAQYGGIGAAAAASAAAHCKKECSHGKSAAALGGFVQNELSPLLKSQASPRGLRD